MNPNFSSQNQLFPRARPLPDDSPSRGPQDSVGLSLFLPKARPPSFTPSLKVSQPATRKSSGSPFEQNLSALKEKAHQTLRNQNSSREKRVNATFNGQGPASSLFSSSKQNSKGTSPAKGMKSFALTPNIKPFSSKYAKSIYGTVGQNGLGSKSPSKSGGPSEFLFYKKQKGSNFEEKKGGPLTNSQMVKTEEDENEAEIEQLRQKNLMKEILKGAIYEDTNEAAQGAISERDCEGSRKTGTLNGSPLKYIKFNEQIRISPTKVPKILDIASKDSKQSSCQGCSDRRLLQEELANFRKETEKERLRMKKIIDGYAKKLEFLMGEMSLKEAELVSLRKEATRMAIKIEKQEELEESETAEEISAQSKMRKNHRSIDFNTTPTEFSKMKNSPSAKEKTPFSNVSAGFEIALNENRACSYVDPLIKIEKVGTSNHRKASLYTQSSYSKKSCEREQNPSEKSSLNAKNVGNFGSELGTGNKIFRSSSKKFGTVNTGNLSPKKMNLPNFMAAEEEEQAIVLKLTSQKSRDRFKNQL